MAGCYKGMQNMLLRGVGWGNCYQKELSKLLFEKKVHTKILVQKYLNSCLSGITHPLL